MNIYGAAPVAPQPAPALNSVSVTRPVLVTGHFFCGQRSATETVR